jgi:hypothetical protein
MPAPIPTLNRPLPASQGAAEPLPEPTFLQGMAATFRTGRDDQAGHMQDERQAAYMALASSLIDMGNPVEKYIYPSRSGSQVNEQDIWKDVQAAKARDPKLFGDVPLQQGEFDNQWQAKMRARQQGDALTVSRTGWTPWLIGSFGAGFTDPINIATLPFGGAGGGLLRTAARDAVVNSLLSGVQQPLVASERKAQGRDYSMKDFAENMALAPVIGAGFGAVAHGAKVGGQAAAPLVGRAYDGVASGLGNVVAANWDRLPTSLQDRIWAHGRIGSASVDDWLLADTAHALIGGDAMSGGEGAASAVLRREGQIDAASPFVANGAGIATHRDLLSATVSRILAEDPSTRRAPVSSGPLGRSTAISSGAVPTDAAAIFAQRLGGVESGNNNWAVPRDPQTGRPLSSASGLFQFTKGTWLNFFKARFGEAGLNDAEILAKRSDPTFQRTLLNDAIGSYSTALRKAGEPVTAGNLYVMHFAGETGGAKLFHADPGASAAEVMGKAAAEANPFINKMTVGDVLAWADRKMGGSGAPARGEGLQLADVTGDGDALLQAQMQRDLDAVRLDNAQRRAALSGLAPSVDEALAAGERAVPTDTGGVAPDAPAPLDVGAQAAPALLEPRAEDPAAPAPEVMAILPQLRDVIADRGRSLNDVAGLARELGVSEGQVRDGLTSLVAEGGISQRKSGQFQRTAQRMSGPEDVLDFIARHGGIRDNEGHALGLRSLPPEEKVGLNRQQIKEAEAKRRTGSRDWQRMTGRNGPLLRHSGRGIDQLGEMLHEAGYLTGRDSARPTVREVLDFLDQRMLDGKARFPLTEHVEPTAAQQQALWGAEGVPDSRADPLAAHPFDLLPTHMQREMEDFAGNWLGIEDIRSEIDPWIIDRATDLWHEHGANRSAASAFEQAILDYDNARAADVRAAIGDDGFDDIPFDTEPATGRADRAGQGDSGESAGAGASAREGGARGGPDAAPEDPGPQLSDLPQEERTRFLDPDSEAIKAQTESLIHDAQAAVDPAIAERQRQAAQLGADAPLRAENRTGQAQDGTMGLSLFDAADQPTFRLDDDGPERSLSDLLAEYDQTQADLDTMRSCMLPMPKIEE